MQRPGKVSHAPDAMPTAAAGDLPAVWVLRTRIRLKRTVHGAAMDLLQRSPKECRGDLIAQLAEYGALYKMMLAGAGHRLAPGAAMAPAAGQGDADAVGGAQPVAPAAEKEAISTYPMSEVMNAFVFPVKTPAPVKTP